MPQCYIPTTKTWASFNKKNLNNSSDNNFTQLGSFKGYVDHEPSKLFQTWHLWTHGIDNWSITSWIFRVALLNPVFFHLEKTTLKEQNVVGRKSCGSGENLLAMFKQKVTRIIT